MLHLDHIHIAIELRTAFQHIIIEYPSYDKDKTRLHLNRIEGLRQDRLLTLDVLFHKTLDLEIKDPDLIRLRLQVID